MRDSITWKIGNTFWKVGDLFSANITPNGGKGTIYGIVTGEKKSTWLIKLPGGVNITTNQPIPEKSLPLNDPVREKTFRTIFDGFKDFYESESSSVATMQR